MAPSPTPPPPDAGAVPSLTTAASHASHSYTRPAGHSTTTKLIVAVHGIGDQTAYATIQSVALRVSAHLGHEIAPPLGRFYYCPTDGPSDAPAFAVPQMMTKNDPPLDGIGLAEAYWAPIPRQVASQKYVLEETKRWARSVAARIAYRDAQSKKRLPAKTAQRLVVILDEMIETIQTLQRVTFVAEKAGLFKFDLGQLLTDFVGDVQLVADFQVYRQRIVDDFDDTIKRTIALSQDPGARVYIVAHSEGTVVTFVALLEALADPEKYPWIRKIAGLMTIGSPIETHHLLWPALWQEVKHLSPSKEAEGVKIDWHNYMDYGDPIAYELTETTKWLDKTKFGQHLAPQTHAFSRYLLPGKAHVDYWNDTDVFDHFLNEVVHLDGAKQGRFPNFAAKVTQVVNQVTRAKGAIRSRWWVPIFTFAFPYALAAALLMAGAYLLEHSVVGSLPVIQRDAFSISRVFQDVLGVGSLMFGITAASRLPRLSDKLHWWLAGWVVLALSIVIFTASADPATQDHMAWWVGRVSWIQAGHGIRASTIGVGVGAFLIAALSGVFARVSPRHGHLMLPALGVLGAIGVVAMLLTQQAQNPELGASLWPLMLALVLFFYMWWLSALLFDLSFIWRRYARHSVVQERLAELA